MERLRKVGATLMYRYAKQRSQPTSDKRGAKADELSLAPLELIDRMAAQVRPPRTHRHRYFAHYLWVVLIARIYEVFPPLCPKCGGLMRLTAFISHWGHDTYPRRGGHRCGMTVVMRRRIKGAH